jgi:hypothetical protein
VAGGGDHHRIEHHRAGVVRQPRRHGGDDRRAGEHAELDGIHRQVRAQGGELLRDEAGRDGVHPGHPDGALGGQRGDDGHAVDGVVQQGLEVRLDAGPARGVGAGDGEHGDGHGIG